MTFALTGTQTQIKDAARRYLTDRYPASRVAELGDRREADHAAWPELERQGWLDPGLGVVELTVLAEESGRALHPTPWLPAAGLALPVYDAAGAGLPGPATLADARSTCRAGEARDGWRLDGHIPAAFCGWDAAEIVVAARTGDGCALFALRPDGPGTSRTRREGIDPLRESADIALAAAPARLMAGPGLAGPLLTATSDRMTAMLAGEAVGVADRALEFAVGYAKVREQFGRPIGGFQAVAHALADGYADIELARSLAYRAACAVADRDHGAAQALALAVYTSRRAAVRVCEIAIQVCGGMGVTWEFPLHWWYRRALWLEEYHAARGEPADELADAAFAEYAVGTARDPAQGPADDTVRI